MKKPGGKQNQKELEVQRQLEEQRRLEEEQKKKEEENKKFRVISLPDTQLPLFLTKFCVEEVWNSDQPIDFMDNYLKIICENEQIEQLSEIERKVVAQQLVYDLIFVKERVKLNGDSAISETCQGEKTIKQDFEYFKQLMHQHISYFKTPEYVKKIFEYAQESYFSYFNLYNLFYKFKKVERTVQMPVFIDEPTITNSLNNAVYLGVQKITPELEEARMKQEIEAKVQKEEEQKQMEQAREQERLRLLQKEEDERLDPKALEIIQEKIKEAEMAIKSKLEERQKGLSEKLQQLENPKKK